MNGSGLRIVAGLGYDGDQTAQVAAFRIQPTLHILLKMVKLAKILTYI